MSHRAAIHLAQTYDNMLEWEKRHLQDASDETLVRRADFCRSTLTRLQQATAKGYAKGLEHVLEDNTPTYIELLYSLEVAHLRACIKAIIGEMSKRKTMRSALSLADDYDIIKDSAPRRRAVTS